MTHKFYSRVSIMLKLIGIGEKIINNILNDDFGLTKKKNDLAYDC